MSDWSGARNILAVRLDAMGDVLMTTPALRALKEGGGRRITLLTSRSGAAMAPLIPLIDEFIPYEPPWMKSAPPLTGAGGEHEMIARLRDRRFDAAVIFTVYTQSPLPAALLCHLAGIPLRLAHCRENPYQLLTDWIPDPEPEKMLRHECRRQLDLVSARGFTTSDERMSLRVSPSARCRVERLLAAHGFDTGGDWAVVHVGATAASRRYPVGQFGAVCEMLAAGHGWSLVFTGTRDEAPLAAAAMPAQRSLSLAGQLDLESTAALIGLAPLLISNNTGPVHIASALGTPVVDLYALTNPQHTPWKTPHRVLSHDVPCKYCYKSVCPEGHGHCLRLIDPLEVVQAALELRALRQMVA